MLIIFCIVLSSILFFVVAFILDRFWPNSAFGGLNPVRIFKPQPTSFPPNVSNRYRLWAMLLAFAGFMGPCGMHRIYAGKIGTGILWLLTGGLMGIGQVIDIILLASGSFNDRYGRPIVLWQTLDELKQPTTFAQPPPSPVAKQEPPLQEQVYAEEQGYIPPPPPVSDSGIQQARRFNPTSAALSIMGGFLLLVALVLGLVTALHLPEAVGAGLPDKSLERELNELFGYNDWPRLVERIVNLMSVILMLLAATFMILGRRHRGVAHTSRATLGTIGLFLTLQMLKDALSRIDWNAISAMVNTDHVGPAIENYLNSVDDQLAMIAGALFLASIILLAWPARKQPVETTTENIGA